jgi:hypothetical protein
LGYWAVQTVSSRNSPPGGPILTLHRVVSDMPLARRLEMDVRPGAAMTIRVGGSGHAGAPVELSKRGHPLPIS